MKATAKALEDRCTDIGMKVARKIFERRGNHAEAHLTELELAAICSIAVQLGMVEAMQALRRKVEGGAP